jgi:hypothetical protein
MPDKKKPLTRVSKIYNETTEHVGGAYYAVSRNWTPGTENQWEIVQRAEGKPGEGESWFAGPEWELVLKGMSEFKAQAICFILNAPEND